MTSTPSPTHTRIKSLLEIVETREAEQRPFRIDEIDADEARAQTELAWLRTEGLADVKAIDGPTGPTFDGRLTPFGRGTLALVRGEA